MKNKDEYCFPGNRHFGEWLRKSMKQRGVTLLEVAKGSKVSYFKLINIRKRKTSVRLDLAVLLADYFNITIAKLFQELERSKRGLK